MTFRFSFATLLFVVALNAIAGGYYALSGAPDVPIEWLEGSPFEDYTVPGMILMFAVGGSSLFAGSVVLAGWRHTRASAAAAGAILLIWIVTQLSIIGYVSWLQPTILIAALAILLLAYVYPRTDPSHEAATGGEA